MLLAATSAALGAFALIASCGGDDNGNPGAAAGSGGSGGSYAGSGGMGGAAQGGAAGQDPTLDEAAELAVKLPVQIGGGMSIKGDAFERESDCHGGSQK